MITRRVFPWGPAEGAPSGWKLVPIKPTIDMEVAGDEKILERLNDHSFALKEPTPAVLCYQAMLVAAPSPQPSPGAAPDVAGLVETLRNKAVIHRDAAYSEAADAIAAQAAEIERMKAKRRAVARLTGKPEKGSTP